jgi:hypothetical protein
MEFSSARSLWVGVAFAALFMLVLLALHFRSQRLPCPHVPDELARGIQIEDAELVASEPGILRIDAFARNGSARSIGALVVEAAFDDGKVLLCSAKNNELGAPSLVDAPILPGAKRAIRLQFLPVSRVKGDKIPSLRVIDCSCE